MSADKTVRRRVIFRGRVQGVFFRATSLELSRGFDVTGFVRNLPDGTVELEAQGTQDQVAGLVAAIGEQYSQNISGQSETDVPAKDDERSFRIA